MLADLWSFRAADAAAGRVRWAQLTAGALMRSGAAPPPRWGHAAWLSGAGEMVLAGGTGASGKALTDGVWAVGVGCSGDEIRSAERGTLRDLTLALALALAPTQTPTLTANPNPNPNPQP